MKVYEEGMEKYEKHKTIITGLDVFNIVNCKIRYTYTNIIEVYF